MRSLAWLAVLAMTLTSTMAAVCHHGVRECRCTQQNPEVIQYSCYVSSLWNVLSELSQLSPDMTSLKVTCSDQRENYLTNDWLSTFSRLETLTIYGCTLAAMNSQTFSSLSTLTQLTMENCYIPDLGLDEHIFTTLVNLQRLTISASRLTSIPQLSILKALTHLNVSKNELSSISVDLRENVTLEEKKNAVFMNLTSFDLSHNKMQVFPYEITEGALKLREIFFNNNNISKFQVPITTELRNLEVVDGKENPLENVIFPWNFDDFTACHVKTLRLDGNGLDTVDIRKLSALQKLSELRLRNFEITDNVWPFIVAPTLFKLDLSENQLYTINISSLPSLGILLIGSNKIDTLNTTTFSQHTNMLALSASYNDLTSIEALIFVNNKHMLALDLSHNLLNRLDSSSLRGLTSLQYLSLSNNQLTRIPYMAFKDLSYLRQLDLHGNRIKFLPAMTSLKFLQFLDVSHNELLSLSTTGLKGLDNLQFLNISHNALGTISAGELSYCPILLEANYAHNNISTVGNFEKHPSLLLLNLDANSITDTNEDSPFLGMPNLQFLFLDRNQITVIKPNMFPTSLEYLSISQNPIENVLKDSFVNVPKLKQVNLMSSSRLLLLPQYAVFVFGQHKPKPVFNIGFNIFDCGCYMSYLKAWDLHQFHQRVLYHYYPKFEGLEYSQCLTNSLLPYTAKAVPFKDMPMRDFVCAYNESYCDLFCDCCIANQFLTEEDVAQCSCAITCPKECLCFEGGSGFVGKEFLIYCDSRGLRSVPAFITSRATSVYLDGNNLGQLRVADLSHLRDTTHLYLNGSQLQQVEDGAFNDISSLQVLYLHNNWLGEIGSHMFGNMSSLKKLYLHNNQITNISPGWFDGLTALTFISLHHNHLTRLPTQMPDLVSGVALTLALNPWSCDCTIVQSLVLYVSNMNDAIYDRNQICCFNKIQVVAVQDEVLKQSSELALFQNDSNISRSLNSSQNVIIPQYTALSNISTYPNSSRNVDINSRPLRTESSKNSQCDLVINFNYAEKCMTIKDPNDNSDGQSNSDLNPGLLALIIVISILSVMVIVFLITWQRKEIQALIYVKMGVRLFDKTEKHEGEEEAEMAFDAFLSYSNKDEEFVIRTLMPSLEEKEHRYHVCVHYRDFPVGANITDTICLAIKHSSRTILLLSKDFLLSEWCRFEFQTAHHHVLKEGSHKLILILLEDIPEELIDPDLKVLLKTRTYLKVNDRWFWEKLYFALPDIRGRKENRDVLRGMKILTEGGYHNNARTKQTEVVNEGFDDTEEKFQQIKNDQTPEQFFKEKVFAINDQNNKIGDFFRDVSHKADSVVCSHRTDKLANDDQQNGSTDDCNTVNTRQSGKLEERLSDTCQGRVNVDCVHDDQVIFC